MKDNKKVSASIVLVIIVLLGVGYFLWSKNSWKKVDKEVSMIEENSNWQIYKNNEFEFEIPNNWSITDTEKSDNFERWNFGIPGTDFYNILNVIISKEKVEDWCYKQIGTISVVDQMLKKCQDGNPEDRWQTVLSKDSKTSVIFYCWFPSKNNESCDQILSTFKFTR